VSLVDGVRRKRNQLAVGEDLPKRLQDLRVQRVQSGSGMRSRFVLLLAPLSRGDL